VLRVLQYEPQKFKKVTAILCGYLDGVFGRLGPFDQRHPRIAAFCTSSSRKDLPSSGGSSVAVRREDA